MADDCRCVSAQYGSTEATFGTLERAEAWRCAALLPEVSANLMVALLGAHAMWHDAVLEHYFCWPQSRLGLVSREAS